MIVAREQAFLKAQRQFQALEMYVERAADGGQRIDQVERELFGRLLALGHTLLSAFVAAAGDGDAGATLETTQGRTVRRLQGRHVRRYLSIFGELLIGRYVYAAREGQKVERAPLDERLGLPAGEFSYVLEDWLERLCVKESFHEAVSDLHAWLGVAPSERAAEQMNQQMAQHVEAFQFERAAPPADEEAEILVATADGKGVPMRRPLEERVRRGPRRGKGEKANKKQMAYVGAVYTIDPFRRTADDVLDELDRKEARCRAARAATQAGLGRDDPRAGRRIVYGTRTSVCRDGGGLSRARPTVREDTGLPDGRREGAVGGAARVAAAGGLHPGLVPRAGAVVAGGPRVPPRRQP